MGVVLMVLAGLDLVFTLVDEIGETEGTYQTWDAVRYVLFVFPRHIYELLPMTALIGSLAGLGILASANELVVLHASGMKVLRIVWSVMKPAIAVMALGLVLGEFIAPRLELAGELDRALARGEQVALSRYGHWRRDGNEFMHFNAIDPNGVLHRGQHLQFPGSTTDWYYHRRVGTLRRQFRQRSLDAAKWRRNCFNSAENNPSGQVFPFVEKSWSVELTPDLLKVLIIDPDKMSISDLYQYADRFENQGQDGSAYHLSFWKRCCSQSQPLLWSSWQFLLFLAPALSHHGLKTLRLSASVSCFTLYRTC